MIIDFRVVDNKGKYKIQVKKMWGYFSYWRDWNISPFNNLLDAENKIEEIQEDIDFDPEFYFYCPKYKRQTK